MKLISSHPSIPFAHREQPAGLEHASESVESGDFFGSSRTLPTKMDMSSHPISGEVRTGSPQESTRPSIIHSVQPAQLGQDSCHMLHN